MLTKTERLILWFVGACWIVVILSVAPTMVRVLG